MPSIAVIRLPVTVTAMSDTGRSLTVISIPATPLTSTGVKSASGLAVAIVAWAICAAPRMTTEAPGRAGPPSARMTASGSSSPMSRRWSRGYSWAFHDAWARTAQALEGRLA